MGALFRFREFSVQQEHAALKVGTDAMLLGAFAARSGATSILDIGTGTGVIALMLAQKHPDAQIIGIDNDAESLVDCQANFEKAPWANRLRAIRQDVFSWNPEQSFDLIVANPPYYEDALEAAKQRTTNAKHTIDFPLDELFSKCKNWLSGQGEFWMILPASNAAKWILYAEQTGWHCHREITIYGKPGLAVRSVLVFGFDQLQRMQSGFIIRNADNSYTDMYRELTREFHDRPV